MPESIFTLCTRSMKPLGKEFQCNGFIKLKGYMNSEDTFLLPFILKYIQTVIVPKVSTERWRYIPSVLMSLLTNRYIFTPTKNFILYFLSKPIIIHSSIKTDKSE